MYRALKVAVVCFAGLVGNAWGVQYTVTDLGTLGGATSHAYDINNNGQVVGEADTSAPGIFGYTRHAFLWQKDAGMRDLGVCAGPTSDYRYSYARAINEKGQVTGFADYGGGYCSPFFWQDGAGMQNIGGGPYNWGYGINNKGQVVGLATTSDGTNGYPFRWQKDTGMQDLKIGTGGSARGINDNGQVVGVTRDQNGLQYAFSWRSDSGIQNLGTGTGSRANSVNLAGQVVGTYGDSSSNRAFLWSSASGRQDFGGSGSEAYDINNLGQVVGQNAGRAFVWDAGSGMQDLGSLITPASGWTLYEADGINDNGQIVGYGRNASGQNHAFLLTPVPEPSTLALLSMLAMGLVAYSLRRRAGK